MFNKQSKEPQIISGDRTGPTGHMRSRRCALQAIRPMKIPRSRLGPFGREFELFLHRSNRPPNRRPETGRTSQTSPLSAVIMQQSGQPPSCNAGIAGAALAFLTPKGKLKYCLAHEIRIHGGASKRSLCNTFIDVYY